MGMFSGCFGRPRAQQVLHQFEQEHPEAPPSTSGRPDSGSSSVINVFSSAKAAGKVRREEKKKASLTNTRAAGREHLVKVWNAHLLLQVIGGASSEVDGLQDDDEDALLVPTFAVAPPGSLVPALRLSGTQTGAITGCGSLQLGVAWASGGAAALVGIKTGVHRNFALGEAAEAERAERRAEALHAWKDVLSHALANDCGSIEQQLGAIARSALAGRSHVEHILNVRLPPMKGLGTASLAVAEVSTCNLQLGSAERGTCAGLRLVLKPLTTPPNAPEDRPSIDARPSLQDDAGASTALVMLQEGYEDPSPLPAGCMDALLYRAPTASDHGGMPSTLSPMGSLRNTDAGMSASLTLAGMTAHGIIAQTSLNDLLASAVSTLPAGVTLLEMAGGMPRSIVYANQQAMVYLGLDMHLRCDSRQLGRSHSQMPRLRMASATDMHNPSMLPPGAVASLLPRLFGLDPREYDAMLEGIVDGKGYNALVKVPANLSLTAADQAPERFSASVHTAGSPLRSTRVAHTRSFSSMPFQRGSHLAPTSAAALGDAMHGETASQDLAMRCMLTSQSQQSQYTSGAAETYMETSEMIDGVPMSGLSNSRGQQQLQLRPLSRAVSANLRAQRESYGGGAVSGGLPGSGPPRSGPMVRNAVSLVERVRNNNDCDAPGSGSLGGSNSALRGSPRDDNAPVPLRTSLPVQRASSRLRDIATSAVSAHSPGASATGLRRISVHSPSSSASLAIVQRAMSVSLVKRHQEAARHAQERQTVTATGETRSVHGKRDSLRRVNSSSQLGELVQLTTLDASSTHASNVSAPQHLSPPRGTRIDVAVSMAAAAASRRAADAAAAAAAAAPDNASQGVAFTERASPGRFASLHSIASQPSRRNADAAIVPANVGMDGEGIAGLTTPDGLELGLAGGQSERWQGVAEMAVEDLPRHSGAAMSTIISEDSKEISNTLQVSGGGGVHLMLLGAHNSLGRAFDSMRSDGGDSCPSNVASSQLANVSLGSVIAARLASGLGARGSVASMGGQDDAACNRNLAGTWSMDLRYLQERDSRQGHGRPSRERPRQGGDSDVELAAEGPSGGDAPHTPILRSHSSALQGALAAGHLNDYLDFQGDYAVGSDAGRQRSDTSSVGPGANGAAANMPRLGSSGVPEQDDEAIIAAVRAVAVTHVPQYTSMVESKTMERMHDSDSDGLDVDEAYRQLSQGQQNSSVLAEATFRPCPNGHMLMDVNAATHGVPARGSGTSDEANALTHSSCNIDYDGVQFDLASSDYNAHAGHIGVAPDGAQRRTSMPHMVPLGRASMGHVCPHNDIYSTNSSDMGQPGPAFGSSRVSDGRTRMSHTRSINAAHPTAFGRTSANGFQLASHPSLSVHRPPGPFTDDGYIKADSRSSLPTLPELRARVHSARNRNYVAGAAMGSRPLSFTSSFAGQASSYGAPAANSSQIARNSMGGGLSVPQDRSLLGRVDTLLALRHEAQRAQLVQAQQQQMHIMAQAAESEYSASQLHDLMATSRTLSNSLRPPSIMHRRQSAGQVDMRSVTASGFGCDGHTPLGSSNSQLPSHLQLGCSSTGGTGGRLLGQNRSLQLRANALSAAGGATSASNAVGYGAGTPLSGASAQLDGWVHDSRASSFSSECIPNSARARSGTSNRMNCALSGVNLAMALYPEEESAWHIVHARLFSDASTGRQLLLLVQQDVSEHVEAQQQAEHQVSGLLGLLQHEQQMLEAIFPRHVLEHLAVRGASAVAGGVAVGGDNGQHRFKTPGLGALALEQKENIDQVASLATAHKMVTILFSDIVGFTSMCKELPPLEVMRFLNELYSKLDALLPIYKVYKVETIGDCVNMVAGGLVQYDDSGFRSVLPEGQVDELHAVRVLEFAKAMLRVASSMVLPTTGEPLKMRIGLHSSEVLSGIVGSTMPRFCLFGDAVNTASRMESTGRPGFIHVSADTHALLANEPWQETGGVEVKGKGLMQTYLLASDDGGKQQEEALARVMGMYL